MKILKYVGIFLGIVVLVAVGAILYVAYAPPKVPPASTEKVEITPARVERGAYLANHVSLCIRCHSQHDVHQLGWPIVKGTEGTGYCFDQKSFGVDVCAGNLTSDKETGLGAWTDGEILRAIRSCVSRDDRPLLAYFMPCGNFQKMSDEDARSIVAYLRSLAPVKHAVTPPVPGLRNRFYLKLALPEPPKPGPVTAPAPTDLKAYGEYLTQIGICVDCHSDRELYSGGHAFPGPAGLEAAANLTPAKGTVTGNLDVTQFIGLFRAYQHLPPTHSEGPVHAIMPWMSFSGMSDHDLTAIYTFLHSLPPVENHIVKFPTQG
jgi:cytochrome c553